METKLINILGGLSLGEAEQLLDKEIEFILDERASERIKNSVYRKAGIKKSRDWSCYLKRTLSASAAVFILALVSIGGYGYYKEPVAYVDIDINPSIELGVNRWNKIVTAKGYNEEGINILEAKDILNQEVSQGVKIIINTAKEQGYLSKPEGAAVLVASVGSDEGKRELLTKVCEKVVKKYSEENKIEVELAVDDVTPEKREEAEQEGITTGKLQLIQKLQGLDEQITVEEYKEKSVKEILNKMKTIKEGKESKGAEKQKSDKGNSEILIDTDGTSSTKDLNDKKIRPEKNAETSTNNKDQKNEASKNQVASKNEKANQSSKKQRDKENKKIEKIVQIQ